MAERRSLRGRLSETARGVAGTLSSGTKQAVGAVKERVTGDDEVDQLEARTERIREEARREAEQEARQEFQEEYRESVREQVREERKQELQRQYGTGGGGSERGQPAREEAPGQAQQSQDRVGSGLLSMPAPSVPDPSSNTQATVNTGQAPSPISREEEQRRQEQAYVAVGGPPADNGQDREDPYVPLDFEF